MRLEREVRWGCDGRLWEDLGAGIPWAISGSDALCSHTDTSARSLDDVPRRSNQERLEHVCHKRVCTAEPLQIAPSFSHTTLLFRLNSPRMEATVINIFAAPLKKIILNFFSGCIRNDFPCYGSENYTFEVFFQNSFNLPKGVVDEINLNVAL